VQFLLSGAQGFRLLVVAPVLTVVVVGLVHDLPGIVLVLALLFGIWIPAAVDGGPLALSIQNSTDAQARITLVLGLVAQACVVAVALLVGTAESVWITRLVVLGGGMVTYLLPVRAAYRRSVLRPRLPRFDQAFWRFALTAGMSTLVGLLVLSRTEVLGLQALADAGAVGLFAVSFGIAQHVYAPVQAIANPLTPAIAALREVSPDRLGAALLRVLRITTSFVGLVGALAIPLCAFVIPSLYGDEYRPAVPVFVCLALAAGLSVLSAPLAAFTLARFSAKRLLRINLVALAVDIVLMLVLIPPFAVWGAVVANASGAATAWGLLLATEARVHRFGLQRVVMALRPSLWGGVGALVGWRLSSQVSSVWVGGVCALSGVAIFVLLVKTAGGGLLPEDTAAVTNALHRRMRALASWALFVVSTGGSRSGSAA